MLVYQRVVVPELITNQARLPHIFTYLGPLIPLLHGHLHQGRIDRPWARPCPCHPVTPVTGHGKKHEKNMGNTASCGIFGILGSISYIGNAINGYFQWIDDHPSLLIQLWTMASYRVPEKSWDAMVFLRVSGWFEDEVTRISENQYLQQAHPSDKTATMIMFGSYTFVAPSTPYSYKQQMTGTRNSDWDKATASSCCGWLKSLFMDNFRERERESPIFQ